MFDRQQQDPAAASSNSRSKHQQSPKLQILVLHGSRQDGEVFSQRLKTLTRKLKNIAVSGCLADYHTGVLVPRKTDTCTLLLHTGLALCLCTPHPAPSRWPEHPHARLVAALEHRHR